MFIRDMRANQLNILWYIGFWGAHLGSSKLETFPMLVFSDNYISEENVYLDVVEKTLR